MKVYGTKTFEVNINPKYVIEGLMEKALGGRTYRNWVKEENGKFYKVTEHSAGSHGIEMDEEITKDEYDYVMALKFVLNNMPDE